MVKHALAERPNECVGLLAGRRALADTGTPAPICRAIKRYPLVNELDSPVEFLSSAESMFAADRDMYRQGLEILAVYHSHPTSAPVPSRKDRERGYSPDVVNFIISLQSTEPAMRGWWIREDGYQEADWEAVE
jgi:proteasome lid subunit RPN8/RPN11